MPMSRRAADLFRHTVRPSGSFEDFDRFRTLVLK